MGTPFLPFSTGIICGDPGDNIQYSLRLEDGSLTGTAGAGALSMWVKRIDLGTQTLNSALSYNSNDQLNSSTRRFRDPHAWTHLFIDASDLYINGELLQGGQATIGNTFSGGFYIADVIFPDVAAAHTDFGTLNSDGFWVPKNYSGSYGAGGFRLQFANASSLGEDTSGNGNDWTPSGLVSSDQVTDTPTNNYAVLSPIDLRTAGTLTNGNLTTTGGVAAISFALREGGEFYYEQGGSPQTINTPFDTTVVAGTYNFGASPFSGSGGQTISTSDIPCPDIIDPEDYLAVRIVTGGAGVSDLAFDLTTEKGMVLSKRLDGGSFSSRVTDTVSGAQNIWEPDTAGPIQTEAQGLTAFTAGGYNVGTAAEWQGTRQDIIMRAGPLAGFDIIGSISHTTGTPTVVAHNAGGAIEYAWVVRTDAGTDDHRIFHTVIGSNSYAPLNSSSAPISSTGWFTSDSSNVTLGSNLPTGTWKIYVWRSISQFSRFTSYTGNANANGPVQLLDFTPRVHTSLPLAGSGGRVLMTLDRVDGNPRNRAIHLDSTGQERVDQEIVDFNSNNFKIRTSLSTVNDNGVNFATADWARVPLKFARGI